MSYSSTGRGDEGGVWETKRVGKEGKVADYVGRIWGDDNSEQ